MIKLIKKIYILFFFRDDLNSNAYQDYIQLKSNELNKKNI